MPHAGSFLDWSRIPNRGFLLTLHPPTLSLSSRPGNWLLLTPPWITLLLTLLSWILRTFRFLNWTLGECSHCVYGGTGQGIGALGPWSQTNMGSVPDICNRITCNPFKPMVCTQSKQQKDSRAKLPGSNSNSSLTSQLLTLCLSLLICKINKYINKRKERYLQQKVATKIK